MADEIYLFETDVILTCVAVQVADETFWDGLQRLKRYAAVQVADESIILLFHVLVVYVAV